MWVMKKARDAPVIFSRGISKHRSNMFKTAEIILNFADISGRPNPCDTVEGILVKPARKKTPISICNGNVPCLANSGPIQKRRNFSAKTTDTAARDKLIRETNLSELAYSSLTDSFNFKLDSSLTAGKLTEEIIPGIINNFWAKLKEMV